MTIRGRWAIVLLSLLVLSIGLNLFGLGVVAARQAIERESPGILRIIAVIMAPFPPEVRRGLRGAVIAERREFIAAAGELRAARQEAFEAMRAEPFDEAALTEAMVRVREKGIAIQELAQTQLIRVLAEAGPETRQKIKPPMFPDIEGMLDEAEQGTPQTQ